MLNENYKIVRNLISALEQYGLYKDFDKVISDLDKGVKVAEEKYNRFKTLKRLIKCIHAMQFRSMMINEYKKINIEEVNKTLNFSKRFIDEKYWDFEILINLEFILRDGLADSIEQAIALYESKKNKK